MTITDEMTNTQIQEIDDEALLALFDAEARQLLGMSGDEFRRSLDAGEYAGMTDDPVHHAGITYLAIFDSFVRPGH